MSREEYIELFSEASKKFKELKKSGKDEEASKLAEVMNKSTELFRSGKVSKAVKVLKGVLRNKGLEGWLK